MSWNKIKQGKNWCSFKAQFIYFKFIINCIQEPGNKSVIFIYDHYFFYFNYMSVYVFFFIFIKPKRKLYDYKIFT